MVGDAHPTLNPTTGTCEWHPINDRAQRISIGILQLTFLNILVFDKVRISKQSPQPLSHPRRILL
jgi:hypothetical protein